MEKEGLNFSRKSEKASARAEITKQGSGVMQRPENEPCKHW